MSYFMQTPEEMEEFAEFLEEDLENIERVISEVISSGIDAEFMIHAKAETVEESTGNTGMKAKNIVKTLVFMGKEPVAVLCPGDTSVSEEKLEDVLDSSVRMAKPKEVKDATGYYVGGVSPFDLDIKVLMEESLLNRDEVRPAAGSRIVGLKISPEEMQELSGAEAVDVSR